MLFNVIFIRFYMRNVLLFVVNFNFIFFEVLVYFFFFWYLLVLIFVLVFGRFRDMYGVLL